MATSRNVAGIAGKHTGTSLSQAMQAQRKSGPMCWGHYSKRQKGGKSGKTLQGVVLASRATIRKLSRTMCCGEGHVAMCGLFCCSEIKHLPRQRFLSHGPV